MGVRGVSFISSADVSELTFTRLADCCVRQSSRRLTSGMPLQCVGDAAGRLHISMNALPYCVRNKS